MLPPPAAERQARRRRIEEILAHRRDIAQRLNAREPAWDVMYGVASRLFWAFPSWRAPSGLIVSAPTPDELLAQMRAAEARCKRLTSTDR